MEPLELLDRFREDYRAHVGHELEQMLNEARERCVVGCMLSCMRRCTEEERENEHPTGNHSSDLRCSHSNAPLLFRPV